MSNALARLALGVASPVMIGSGAGAWAMISKQLKEQRMTVHDDHGTHAGKPIADPITAYAQAEVVAKHAEHIGGGRTFAEISEEWMEAQKAGDEEKVAELAGPREMVMQANFVRASLFTSVLAYGGSALVVGLGVLAGFTAVGLDD